MKLNYGIIGTGMMGCEHIRNLKKIPDVKIVAIADPDERSRKWAEILVRMHSTLSCMKTIENF